MTDDLYTYVAIDYYATGEGRSIYLLITRAYPRSDDYETQPSFTEKYEYIPGVLKNSTDTIALRELTEKGVDPYFIQGAEILEREEFLKRHQHLLPDFVIKTLNQTGNDRPGNFKYFMDTHFNYS